MKHFLWSGLVSVGENIRFARHTPAGIHSAVLCAVCVLFVGQFTGHLSFAQECQIIFLPAKWYIKFMFWAQ